MIFASGPYIKVFGFRRDCNDGFRVRDEKRAKVSLYNYRYWDEIPLEFQALLVEHDAKKAVGFKGVLSRSWRLWVGTREKRLAIFGWTRASEQSGDFFFPIDENAVLIWYTETLADQRGYGLLPLMLDYMVYTLSSEGIRRAYGTCASYNYPSRWSLEKANFRLIGQGLMRSGSGRGLLWIPVKQPVAPLQKSR
jgi:hypothetical protein